MYKDYSSIVQSQIDKLVRESYNTMTISNSISKKVSKNRFTLFNGRMNAITSQFNKFTQFSNHSLIEKQIKSNIRLTRNALNFQNISKSYFEKVGFDINIKPVIADSSKFTGTLFSEKALDFIKDTVNDNNEAIDATFSLLRYEYVKNTLVYAKSIRQIKWEPITLRLRKYTAQVQSDDVQNDSNEDKKIQELSPLLSELIKSLFVADLLIDLKPYITFLANEFLPYLPAGIRNTVLLFLIIVVVFNKTNEN